MKDIWLRESSKIRERKMKNHYVGGEKNKSVTMALQIQLTDTDQAVHPLICSYDEKFNDLI